MSDETAADATPEERRALFRVVNGHPDDAELAALTAVVAAAASVPGDDPAPAAPDLWSHPAALLRAPLQAGPGAWRASGLPR
ncbi:acyl-CoA carboxylase epsilon subunit [Pseudonocardia sp. KRD291]|uniref:acyl-CoA carboxylase epsilon subunit n=1 Tax=Pseudonocardia sp. KRD291 TaxID=2792007 RepID=UPI001C4A6776|nr:acyl-CoA carboxylase epsilon subunit [Pseudonocardia sp. KRD291]MBW0103749.1 acyl-CoA carboxylase subunit epsilon [Pseudonocardia sp. KRD291]